jgi:hypothetical protein
MQLKLSGSLICKTGDPNELHLKKAILWSVKYQLYNVASQFMCTRQSKRNKQDQS